MYFATFLMQSNFEFFRVWAWEANKPRVNIVAVLVDDKIYDKISNDLERYTSSYIQQKLSDTKALILPLHLETVSAYDIHRMMENIYFDWLEDVNSSLIWLVMVWDIPMPVVNQNWYVFPTVYPYVDFENQKYVWDSETKYFIPDWNAEWQAEIWHWLINYGSDISAYSDFFNKIKKYSVNPDGFVWDAMWYEDFIAEKEWFLNENYQYYRNKIMFAEDLWYQRYSPLMRSLFNTDSTDKWVEILDELKEVVDKDSDWIDVEIPVRSSDEIHTTKLVQQEIEDSYLADYWDLFSKVALTTRRENIFAWWRWIKTYKNEDWTKTMEVNADSSLWMVQLKDTLYLWDDNLVWVIQNVNNILEKFVDDKIDKEKYSMDLVIPVEYRYEKWKRVAFKCYTLVTDYENYYFWKDARFVDNVNDLSIYRWTYRNLTWIDWLKYSDITWWFNSVVSNYDKTDVTKKSIWASYDIFSNQVEWNRGYVMMNLQNDISEYNENKTRAQDSEKTKCMWFLCKIRRKYWPSKCDSKNCEILTEFAKRWWWWASVINLDFDSVGEWRYRLSWFAATDSWRSIFDMWWYQSLLPWDDEWSSWRWWVHWTWVWPQWDATNFKSYIKYSSPTEVQWWNKARWWYRIYDNHMSNIHDLSFWDMDYWKLSPDKIRSWTFKQESDKFFTIENVRRKRWLNCWWSDKYTYKFISSVVKHDSTKDDEINWVERDLYGETWKLWKYYMDVESAYSWLYQDIKNIINSWENLTVLLDDRLLELSWYESELQNAFSWLHSLLNDSIADNLQEKAISEQVLYIEDNIPEILSWIENIFSWSRNEFVDLYSSISSLFADNIINTLEHIVNLEWWELEVFYENPYSTPSVKVPFLSSWMNKVKSLMDSILNVKDSLLEVYDKTYNSLSWIRQHWINFYSGYETDVLKLTSLSGDFDKLNTWFVNMFILNVEEDEEDEDDEELEGDVDIMDELENQDSEWEDEENFIELTWWSVLESVENLINSFTGSTGANGLFLHFFEVDARWNLIILEALKDEDFNDWIENEWKNIKSLSQADLITEYAKRANWDWYASDWARRNHELLVWVVEHMSWMNFLTPDRPIDSPRYVSMQSINGKELKFIYPDLFKVEVFQSTWKNKSGYDVHLLLTRWQIKQNLIKYIKNKVSEYNTLLNVKALTGNIYYDKIEKYDKYATPYKSYRPYKLFTYEEFVDAIWGEQMLDVIADVLYYQNLTNKKKLHSSEISEDISFIKDSFNLNDKREYVLEDYLTEWKEEEKHPLLVIPKYELSGYEVAYVNSDWGDFVIPTDWNLSEFSGKNQWKNIYVKVRKTETSSQWQEMNDKCNIPANWKLPLFSLDGGPNWFQWFLCWWEETKKSPLKLSLSFDSSFWDMFVSNWFNETMESLWKSLLSETKDSLKNWKDAKSSYVDDLETLIFSSSDSDSDKVITQSEIEAEEHNRMILSWNSWVSNALSNIKSSVKISNSNGNLTDNNPTSLLEISSIYDVQNIIVTIEWTWDGCLKLNENKVCPWDKITTTFNPKTNPFKWVVESFDNRAWSSAFDIKYGLWGDKYIEKIVKYTVSPGSLAFIDVNFWNRQTVAWMLTPVEVIGRDKNKNKVSWWLKKYNFIVDTWKFLKDGMYVTGFTTNDFRNLRFYYQAPSKVENWSEALVQVIESSEFNDLEYKPLIYRQSLIQWSLEVQLNNKTILKWDQTWVNQSYRLWTGESIYKNGSLDLWSLQKLDLYIKDVKWNTVNVESQVIVTSQNWLITLWQVQKNDEWKNVFFETSKYYMSWWHLVIYYYPTKVSWNDVVKIEVPWLESRIINLSILPAPLENIQFRIPREVLQLWDKMTGEVFFMDKWWNLVDQSWIFKFYYDEDKIEISWWKGGEVTRPYNDWYISFEIMWKWGGLSYIYSDDWSYVSVTVDKHLFPKSWLNILYLNYFGNDRWNQWWYFSDNDNYIESIMKESKKIITTTTQIVSEDKIKKMLWKIWPWFQIWNQWNQKVEMFFHWNNFGMLIWDISSMQWYLPSFGWNTLTQEYMESILLNAPNKNYAFFIPNDSNYKISDWILYSWTEKIWSVNNGDISLSLSDSVLDNGDNVWVLTYKWVIYWYVIFHLPWFVPSLSSFENPWDRYLFANTFSNWSTYDLKSIWLFDQQSDFELNTSYKSIQNSDELQEKIWFLWDFKNITLFAEWEIVGEATKKYWSEFVINLWDPVLSRKTKNQNVYHTNYDGWIWQEIYVDSENQIFWTYQIDFNWDSNKDLLVVYLDWSVKLAKSYWWNPDLRNMQDLMRIAVAIKNVFIWDVNGDKYDDIIVQTDNNQLRVYLNKNGWVPWEFDVDWNVACLNLNVNEWWISTDPADISWVYELYVEDMDKDGIMDIVIYDKLWYVKIFYWWTTKWWPNYLSKDKYSCDTSWYDREKNNIKVVTKFWLDIKTVECYKNFNVCWSDEIYDNSMLHRDWMVNKSLEISKWELSEYWINFDENDIQKNISIKDLNWSDSSLLWAMNLVLENTDIDQASKRWLENWAKYQDVTLYGDSVLPFAPISFLDDDSRYNPVYVYKTYIVPSGVSFPLKQGDKIWVVVTIKNISKNPSSTLDVLFWDVIQGPWNLYFDKDDIFEWIRILGYNTWSKLRENRNKILYNYFNVAFWTWKVFKKWEIELKKRDWKFSYLVSKKWLKPWELFRIWYELEYTDIKVKDVSLSYDWTWDFLSSDKYPDIKIQSIDGCDKDFLAFLNKWKSRDFFGKKIPLQSMIEQTYTETMRKSEDYSQNISNIGSNVNALPGIVWDSINRIQLINAWVLEITNDDKWKKDLKDKLNDVLLNKIKDWKLDTWNLDFDIDLSIFEEKVEWIENELDNIIKGMCEGFSFWWSNNCKWLPVPFNQAFFAPWKYHLFGCWNLPLWSLENWLPVFFFPGTIYALWVPLPIPNWMKNSALDSFIWVPWWSYPSMIRIYAAPTLTSQLWIAVCVSPDRIWKKIPSPISDIMGNCVVFAVKPKCSSKNNDNSDIDNPNETYSTIIETIENGKTCTQTEKWVQIITKWKRSSPFDLYWNLGSKNWWSFGNSDSSFLWIIELETSSFVWSADSDVENSIMIWDVEILWWDYDVNKIKWWIQQWVRKILIDKWLDPQIRYIVNQLTKMHINIKLPNLSNLIWYEAEILNNLAQEFENENDEEETSMSETVSAWKNISYDSLNNLNQDIANPFESLASLMNQSNIINISTEPLVVKVPFITNEDISTYGLYLQQWLEDNKKIVAEWSGVINSLVWSCSKRTLQEAQEMCRWESSDKQKSCIETNHKLLNDNCLKRANEYRESLIEFEWWDWDKMVNQIYNNILILQKYRNFPFEMYEWIHVIDRYMAEIASLISDTIWYLSYWTSQNAERFVWYVDAIVLMLNIIKTYQLIIDFSVEWSENCGNCAKDTYDQYSCKLSLLCNSIQLPIIQIPNFKLPNITIDLTNIDLGLDIVLPEFNFQTVRIDLPQLPNLPYPPSMWANIKLFDLPNIPQLPEPPHLPELPSFIPEIELELPILPPAPELPKLPNQIESLIKVAKLIWKIYCIVKWNFWLVGESSVKAKIEQLTQRTYSVDRIDNIMDFTNWTAAPVKNYGVDYEISAYVDMQINLSDFYNFLDSLTNNINNLTTDVVNTAQTSINTAANTVFEPVSDVSDDIESEDFQFNTRIFGKDWIISKLPDNELDWIVSNDVEYVDYSSAKNRLQDVLAYFKKEWRNTTLTNRLNSAIDKIENQILTPNVIESNLEWISKVRDEAIEYIKNKEFEYSGLENMISNDYEKFLTMIDSESYLWEETKSVLNSWKILTFNVNLFNLDSSTEEVLKKIKKENPYATLLDNKQDIIDWYLNAVNKNTADDLWLSQNQYLVLRDDLLKMKAQLSNFYSVVKPSQSTKLVAKNWWNMYDTTLVASSNAAVVRNPKPASDKQFSVDPSGFAAWIYEKIIGWLDEWKLTKVVYSDSFVSSIWDNHYKTSLDVNHDIIMWTSKAIYKKCFSQKCWDNGVQHYKSIYKTKSIREIPYEETWIAFDSDTKLKIADWDQEVKNWKVKWQTYDSFTLSWKVEDVDAYLIKLVTRIDSSYEKSDRKSDRVNYILVLPKEENVYENRRLELMNKKIYSIKDLIESDQIVEVVDFDINKLIESIIVTWPKERKRYYANIATLKFNDNTNIYNINSPWSNQIVAWKQMIWDDQWPSIEPNLYRIKTNDVVSEWEVLDWYIWTEYVLNIPWKDNVALSYINVSKDGKILAQKYTNKPEDVLSVSWLFRTKNGIETYNTVWIDQFENKVEKTITVNYSVPEVAIVDVLENQDKSSVSIIAELSHDIDTWNVSFQRKRWETWKTMKINGSEGDLPVVQNQTRIVWSPYSQWNKIALYDSDDSVMALIDPNTAEIVLQSGYRDSHEIKVWVDDSAIIKFYNKEKKRDVFGIYLPIKELVDLKADSYVITSIPEKWKMWMFNWGKVVSKDGDYILLISPTGHLYSDRSLEWTYKYDIGLNALEFVLYQPSDKNKNNPIKVWVRVQPFEMK